MATDTSPVIGIIGGSGLYHVEGLERTRWKKVESPFGETSDELLLGEIEGVSVAFLPRHGRGHRIPPSEINYRANIDALKRVGVTDILSISAVGSLREGLSPGAFVIVDQFIDRTIARERSFFGKGLIAHVSMAKPVCSRLGDALETAAHEADVGIERGGTYLVMEGPQFSTLAESQLYRSWACDVIGMTNMPEAKLAREAEMCYATIAMVTDYDCWHDQHEDVTVEAILAIMEDNAEKARSLIHAVIPHLKGHAGPCREGCQRVLNTSIVTAPDARDPQMIERLDAVAGRALAG
jgi:5'-methylthioadenosine phosphorylase